MADIRINALATTASSTASDDFLAVDGSANGTRKLNAYSPTFGGNLTVSGTGNSSVAGNFLIGTTTDGGQKLQVAGGAMLDHGTNLPKQHLTRNGDYATLTQYKWSGSSSTYLAARITTDGDGVSPYGGKMLLQTSTAPAAVGSETFATALTLDSSQNATFAGDLTVSGGNIGVGGASEPNIGASFAGMNISASSGYAGMVMGLGATLNATGNAQDFYGLYFNPTLATAAKTGLNFFGARFAGFTASGGGTITTAVGISISNLASSGNVTNAYGIDIQTQSGASAANVAIRAAGKIMFTSLPTSSAGLASGELWNDSGTLKIVP